MTFNFLDSSAVNRPSHFGQTFEQAAIYQPHFVQAFELVGATLFMGQAKQDVKEVTPDLERASGISSAKTGLGQAEGFARHEALKIEHLTQVTFVTERVEVIEFFDKRGATLGFFEVSEQG